MQVPRGVAPTTGGSDLRLAFLRAKGMPSERRGTRTAVQSSAPAGRTVRRRGALGQIQSFSSDRCSVELRMPLNHPPNGCVGHDRDSRWNHESA